MFTSQRGRASGLRRRRQAACCSPEADGPDGGAARTGLLAAVVGSLARAASSRRPDGLPAGPVGVRVRDDAGRWLRVDGADLLSPDGVRGRLSGAGPDDGDPARAALDVIGTAGSGTTLDVLPVRAGAVAVLTVGPAVRRPVVVVGEDDQEQIGIRSVVWLALSTSGALASPDASALLAHVGHDLRRGVGR